MDKRLTANESEPLPRDKVEMLERMEAARTALDETIARLSDEQLTPPGPHEGWSVKDHLAHVAAWEHGIAALLQRSPRYAAMQVDETDLSDRRHGRHQRRRLRAQQGPSPTGGARGLSGCATRSAHRPRAAQ